jgi:HrpA-like RNA helicase
MEPAMNTTLPIYAYREQIISTIKSNQVTIIVAETGAGKSTQVPLFLLEQGATSLVTQPRRLATRTVAERVAFEYGEEIGRTIGYRTALERNDCAGTRCLFCTDGLAQVRMLMGKKRADGSTFKYDVLVLDETHEWNLNMEVLVAWSKLQLQQGAHFKVVLMSATIEADKLSQYFNNAPIINVPGRQFPVEERPAKSNLLGDTMELLKEGRNVLVFQPGKREIEETIEDLKSYKINAEVLPLHGEMTAEDQALVFKHYGRPKCIVSTNVAQTSVTIDDIDAVVDSGMERRIELSRGVQGLYLRPIALSDSAQRKGRAGRTRPGIYIDHCDKLNESETEYDDEGNPKKVERPEFPIAEIQRLRLDQAVLRLAQAGFDAEALEFFHQPDKKEIHEARRALKALGCMDGDGNVTEMGHKIAGMPIAVKYGRMLVEAEKHGVVPEVITAAALLECGGITMNKDAHLWHQLCPDEKDSDINAQLEVYKAAQSLKPDEMKKKGINVKSFFRVKQTRKHLSEALKGIVEISDEMPTLLGSAIHSAICAGMVDNLYLEYGQFEYQNADGTRQLSKDSVLRRRYTTGRSGLLGQRSWIVGLPWDLHIKDRYGRSYTLNLIRMAMRVDALWLSQFAPHLLQEKIVDSRYSARHGQTTRTVAQVFNGQTIETWDVVETDPVRQREAFAKHLVRELQESPELARVYELNRRAGYEAFPYSEDSLLAHVLSHMGNATCNADLEWMPVYPDLDPEKVKEVLTKFPDTIMVGDKQMKIHYTGTVPEIRFERFDPWQKVPDEGISLADGRVVHMVFLHNFRRYMSGLSFKTDTAAELNRAQIDRFNIEREFFIAGRRPQRPNLNDPNAKISVVEIKIGTCVLTGKPLLAYGTLRMTKGWYGGEWNFDPVWSTDRNVINNIVSNSETVLEEALKSVKERFAADNRRFAEEEAERIRIEAARAAKKEAKADKSNNGSSDKKSEKPTVVVLNHNSIETKLKQLGSAWGARVK